MSEESFKEGMERRHNEKLQAIAAMLLNNGEKHPGLHRMLGRQYEEKLLRKFSEEHRACLLHKSRRLPGITIPEGGRIIRLSGSGNDSLSNARGDRRAIKDFTPRSRQNLQRAIASINEYECGLPDFGTLTYPDGYSSDWKDWKKNLDAWIHALVRKWPSVWGLWRLEFQKRGAPHFHFLLWDGPQVEGMEIEHQGKLVTIAKPGDLSPHNAAVFKWIGETWFRIVGSGDLRHLAFTGFSDTLSIDSKGNLRKPSIEPIQSWNGVMSYASKYLAKLPDGNFVPPDYDGTGRFWGRIGKARWKVTMFERPIPERVFFGVKRMLRGLLERKGVDVGKMKRRGRGDQGVTAYVDSVTALRLLNWAWEYYA